MNENTRIANALREASANIREIQNKNCEHDLEINEQLANEMLELERILGWDVTRPEGFTFERLARLIDPTCWIERSEQISNDKDGEYIKLEWHCTNCDFKLTERYDDLDAAAREELGLFYCPHCGKRIIGTIFDK